MPPGQRPRRHRRARGQSARAAVAAPRRAGRGVGPGPACRPAPPLAASAPRPGRPAPVQSRAGSNGVIAAAVRMALVCSAATRSPPHRNRPMPSPNATPSACGIAVEAGASLWSAAEFMDALRPPPASAPAAPGTSLATGAPRRREAACWLRTACQGASRTAMAPDCAAPPASARRRADRSAAHRARCSGGTFILSGRRRDCRSILNPAWTAWPIPPSGGPSRGTAHGTC